MGRPAQTTIKRFVSNVVEKPQVFFTANDKIVDQALGVAKHFYNTAKKNEELEFSPFPELLTEGFDRDQIWEEIATQNEPFLSYAKTTVAEFARKRKRSELEQELEAEQDDEEESVSGRSMDLDDDENEDSGSGYDNEEFLKASDDEAEQEGDEEEELGADDLEQDDDLEEEEINEEEEEISPKKKKRSEVDDDFFNLEEFNNWTEKQEELDMMSDREEEDDALDFDNDMNDEEDEDDDEDLGDVSEMKFEEFFLPANKKRTSAKPIKQVKFALDGGDDDEEGESRLDDEEDLEGLDKDEPLGDDDDDDDDEELIDQDEEDEEDKDEHSARDLFAADEEEEEEEDESSVHQKRLDRIKAQIEQFEQENIDAKHWTLRGEATAKSRPVNSLLEEDLEFDHSAKPVPVITQETTNALEDIIKKRILDNQFDDVERKQDPTLRPFLPSKRVNISDERSKRSLAELYEDDFVKQKTGDTTNEKDEALKQEHEEITSMFDSLCHKLDALSNFHFTPKAPKAEVTIVSDAPAISMEEVTPVNVSEATLLAPEEVYEKKQGDVKSKSEMSQDERKRAHAQKRKMKRKEKSMKEREMKLISKMNPGMGHKQAKMKAVKDLLGQKVTLRLIYYSISARFAKLECLLFRTWKLSRVNKGGISLLAFFNIKQYEKKIYTVMICTIPSLCVWAQKI
ncbi:U3 small nucleolar ribonucleoprotein complex, subunit Mpp10 [Zychaea mexicana]|uniref:U3 small nucleolar ribonucleoprotein complex, subunit Mpp10 n=1 Tax=Zychaea mexicana TaxID=64656 RepID=UPI0022FE7232|nr:U3 small nucleolar ribonucleoprotein complex, subunit Mpp10 [Zychaea mexicana]KAI9493554.1 U3 small nucleolar ribonucleoprotein complex, subunit Mpp10 [Zychaea mexicana]